MAGDALQKWIDEELPKLRAGALADDDRYAQYQKRLIAAVWEAADAQGVKRTLEHVANTLALRANFGEYADSGDALRRLAAEVGQMKP